MNTSDKVQLKGLQSVRNPKIYTKKSRLSNSVCICSLNISTSWSSLKRCPRKNVQKKSHFSLDYSKVDIFVFTSAVHTKSSALVNTLDTLPMDVQYVLKERGHPLLGCISLISIGRYSWIHLNQNWFDKTWVLHHCLHEVVSEFANTPGDITKPWWWCRRGLGDNHHRFWDLRYLGKEVSCW